MHKYEKLEKIYYQNKIKSLLFKFFILIIIACGVCFVFVATKQQKNNYNIHSATSKESNHTNKTNPNKIKQSVSNIKKQANIAQNNKKITTKEQNFSKSVTNSSNKGIKNKNSKLNLSPVLPDLSKLEQDTNQTISKTKTNTNSITHKTKNNTKKTKQIIPPKPKPVKILIQSEKLTLQGMIDSFSNMPTYDLAIRIAKVYYRKGEYHPSIAWIKKAYSINAKNYQSWYWLAKNLLKLGNKTKAKEVLQAYISNYGANDDIENLLRSINE